MMLKMATVILASLAVAGAAQAAPADQAAEILEATGVRGGLVVHVGCGDGMLTAALRAGDGYLVHGLDRDPVNVDKARKHIQSLGAYGKIAIDRLDGPGLPYVDNLVNLLVFSRPQPVDRDEVLRVLCPGGVAVTVSTDDGREITDQFVKPWPAEIDEWTHHLHDAGGNAVAKDRLVGPPRHLQWTAGPLWARSHGWTPSVSAMVSAGGRVFYIGDETLTCADATVPNKWFLVARDAFSGVRLWKVPVPQWGSKAHSGTPDTGGGGVVGRFTMPTHIGKRLVAVGDTVYVTLGADAPVTALDAATGETRRVYAETARADEILCTDDRLIVSINPSQRSDDAASRKQICAVDVKTGRVLWKKGPVAAIRTSLTQDPYGRVELAAGDGQVFVLTQKSIECLAIDAGKTLWRIDRPELPADAVRRLGYAGMYEYLLTVMVYHNGVVLLAQPEPNTHHTYHTMPGTLFAFDAKDGRQLWKHPYGGWGHCTPPDVFVVNDVVWTHVNAETEFGSVWGSGYRAKNSAEVNYRIQAVDLRTGKLRQELPTRDIFNVGHHHRCYRNKITERFLMASRRGAEFVDLTTGENFQNHWVRSGCLLGNLPCNGLLYVTPHPCGCYIEAKLTGFNALSAGSGEPRAESRKHQETGDARLEKGPVYAEVGSRKSEVGIGDAKTVQSAIPHSDDWPAYRHDSRRSGATESPVNAKLALKWRSDLGAKPSPPVVADGKVFVAGIDAHTVHALDSANGKPVWQYTAGGRVPSPPTFHQGSAIFGSADGRVYCLRAADGALAWCFDAAPERVLLSAFGQLESPWPVPGIAMHAGECWFAAGRSSYLDDGIRVYALDPSTGEVAREETIYSPDPKTGKITPEPSANSVAGLLNDIPTTDGTNVYVRQMKISPDDGGANGPHLYTTGGFLDSSWFNRTYWKYGRAQTSGLMVLGDDAVYGVEVFESRSRETVFKPGSSPYRLVCLSLKPPAANPRDKASKEAKPKARGKRQSGPQGVWQQRVGIRITAMIRAGDTIFVAGSPDVVDGEDPHAAWEGRLGGTLAAFAASDGKKLAEYELSAPPVWDGMAASRGQLYISLLDGTVVCFGEATRGK
jgi:outer membrane protein assembly factor BamB